MLKSVPFATAVAAVVGVVYVLCRLIAFAAPQVLFSIAQSWFHTFSLDPNRATGSLSPGMFFLGLASSVAFSWITAYGVAGLYNRLAKQ